MRECDDCGSRISGDGCGFCQRFESVFSEPTETNYRISTQDLLDDLRAVADELGATPSKEQYSESGEYAPNTIINRFGKWNQAVRVAGLLPNQFRRGGAQATLASVGLGFAEARGGPS
jgi:hypothetical protein